MPEPITVRMWVIEGKHPDFSAHYAKAREAQADHYFEEIFEIADDGTNDWEERYRKDKTKFIALNHEHVERSKLRVDARKWALARMAPRKYGAIAAGEPGVNVDVTTNLSLTMIDGMKQVAAHRANRVASLVPLSNGRDPQS